MASITEENYLKALFALEGKQTNVTTTDISKILHVKLPTVTSMMKKLNEQEMVNYQKYHPLSLTDKGKKTAALIVRKHRLCEMFLVKKMNFGWEEVHEIAEELEHTNSTVFFEKMDELLEFPEFDPHGSPIPDQNGQITHQEFYTLNQFKSGDQVRLIALLDDHSDFLTFLNKREITLGTIIRLLNREPFDNSLIIGYNQHSRETISETIAQKLIVSTATLR